MNQLVEFIKSVFRYGLSDQIGYMMVVKYCFWGFFLVFVGALLIDLLVHKIDRNNLKRNLKGIPYWTFVFVGSSLIWPFTLSMVLISLVAVFPIAIIIGISLRIVDIVERKKSKIISL